MVLGLCRQFGKLPEEIYDADTELLRLLAIESMGTPDQEEEGGVNDAEYGDY